jgi:hypothetical protein
MYGNGCEWRARTTPKGSGGIKDRAICLFSDFQKSSNIPFCLLFLFLIGEMRGGPHFI